MVEGLQFIFDNRLFLNIIGLTFTFSLFGMSYVVLLPSFANDILGSTTLQFGLLEAAAGAGAVLGTLAIMRLDATRKGSWLMLCSALIFSGKRRGPNDISKDPVAQMSRARRTTSKACAGQVGW